MYMCVCVTTETSIEERQIYMQVKRGITSKDKKGDI